MRVRAIRLGIFGQERLPGDVFEIPDDKPQLFSKIWMEKLEEGGESKPLSPPPEIPPELRNAPPPLVAPTIDDLREKKPKGKDPRKKPQGPSGFDVK